MFVKIMYAALIIGIFVGLPLLALYYIIKRIGKFENTLYLKLFFWIVYAICVGLFAYAISSITC